MTSKKCGNKNYKHKGELQPIENFNKNGKCMTDASWCKDCTNERSKERQRRIYAERSLYMPI